MSDREPNGRGPKRASGLQNPLTSEVIPDSVVCPFCDGTETEQFSAFGSALSVSQYWCRSCRTVFEWMKWRDEGASR
jgi:rubredoxin